MKHKKHLLVLFLITATVVFSQEKRSMGGAVGAVTLDGKVWNQIALRPVIPIWKFGVALDLVFYFDQDGNLHKEEWDFSSSKKIKNTLIDKIYYVRYGHPTDPVYMKMGALDNVTLGYGILVNDYTNTLLYPDFRKVGLEARIKRKKWRLSGFTADLKENAGLIGLRVETKQFFGVPIGISAVLDRNQYFGLKDRDGDGRPDKVDDFPNIKEYWLDSDHDGLADTDPMEIDRDGDGLPDIDSLPVIQAFWEALEDQIGQDSAFSEFYSTNPDPDPDLLAEPLNVKKDRDAVAGIALDVGIPILVEDKMSLGFYSQVAALIGETIDPETGKSVKLGTGMVPLGLNLRFGPGKFNLEYRMIPAGNFEFNYWDEIYDVNRATYYESIGDSIPIKTKESGLGRFGDQKGFYSKFVIGMGSWIDLSVSYQNMQGTIWKPIENAFVKEMNQNLLARVALTKQISKIRRAEAFYQQKNVPNPFKFENSESTLLGYKIGLQMGSGMVIYYKFHRTFRDVNNDGDVKDKGETFNVTTIETSFSL